MSTTDPESVLLPWEPRPKESPQAYRAFVAYRDMPPNERTLLAAYRLATGHPDAKYPSGSWTKWSREWSWQERVMAWEAHEAKAARDDVIRERRDALKRGATLAAFAETKAFETLQAIEPGKMTVSDALRALEIAHRIKKEALEVPMPAVDRGQDLVTSIIEAFGERALAGDEEAARVVINAATRKAAAEGSDAPMRIGVEMGLGQLFGDVSPVELSPETRRMMLEDIRARRENTIDGEATEG